MVRHRALLLLALFGLVATATQVACAPQFVPAEPAAPDGGVAETAPAPSDGVSAPPETGRTDASAQGDLASPVDLQADSSLVASDTAVNDSPSGDGGCDAVFGIALPGGPKALRFQPVVATATTTVGATVAWTLAAKPAGSGAALTIANGPQATLDGLDAVGTYQLCAAAAGAACPPPACAQIEVVEGVRVELSWGE